MKLKFQNISLYNHFQLKFKRTKFSQNGSSPLKFIKLEKISYNKAGVQINRGPDVRLPPGRIYNNNNNIMDLRGKNKYIFI